MATDHLAGVAATRSEPRARGRPEWTATVSDSAGARP
jgi:hypothetical protein